MRPVLGLMCVRTLLLQSTPALMRGLIARRVDERREGRAPSPSPSSSSEEITSAHSPFSNSSSGLEEAQDMMRKHASQQTRQTLWQVWSVTTSCAISAPNLLSFFVDPLTQSLRPGVRTERNNAQLKNILEACR